MATYQTNQNISNFYRVATQKKFSRDFQLRVNSFIVAGGQDIFGEDDLVYVKSAALPARKITNIKAPYMGLDFNVPGAATYPGSENWSITFYADQALELRQRLEGVMSNTFSPFNNLSNNITLPGTENVIDLILLDDQMNTVSTYSLYGAYITDLGAIDYKMTGNGSIQEIKATVAYQYWVSEVDRGSINQQQGGLLGTLNSITNTARSLTRATQAVGQVFRR